MTTKTCLWPLLIGIAFTACTKSDNLQENLLATSQQKQLNSKMVLEAQKGGTAVKAVRYKADYITDAQSGKEGNTYYFFNTGNKQLGVAFVPKDPSRGGRTDITYAIDDELTDDNGLTNNEVERAIDAAMATWEAQNCSQLAINKINYAGNLGWISSYLGFGGSTALVADIQHSGFLPAEFFEAITPGGSFFILAVTYSFIWVDANGEALDIDKNGKADLAFSEIYYNDAFDWRTDEGFGYDIETIALHESGHGLGQDHFGKAFYNYTNNKFHIAPKAVMNAAYTGEQRTLLGTDKAGHCSIWANWPSN